MKCEDDRGQRMKEATNIQIDRLENQIEAIRAHIAEARRILIKHKITLAGKDKKGIDPGVTQERVDKKQALITALDAKLKDLEAVLQRMRDEVKRLLTFNPIQDSLNHLPPRFRQAEKGEWQLPNSRFTTFQHIFTPPEARIVPDYKRKPSYSEYQRLPIDACPVDPQRIPDWFLEEFGLGSLDGLSDFEKLEIKVKLTPQVREIFRHLKPLKIHGRQTHRAMVLDGYDEAHDGKIMVTSYSGRNGEKEDRKIMQVYGSVYEAHRRATYADEGYEREQEKLHGIKARIRGIQRELVGMSGNDPKKDEMTKRIASELEVMGRVLNCHKAEAADILATAMNINDSLGRYNPGAACARMVKAIGLLEKRLPQIFNKSRWVSDDKRILSSIIYEGEAIMGQAQVASLRLCKGLEQGGDIECRLRSMPDLERLTVRPLSLYGAKLKKKINMLWAGLRKEGNGVIRDEAINAYVVCKVFEVQRERERILHDIAESPMETTIENLLDRARKLRSIITAKETFRDVRTGKNAPYDEMSLKIKTLVRGLQAYSKRNLSESERLAMYERLKKYLEDIDFTEILEKL